MTFARPDLLYLGVAVVLLVLGGMWRNGSRRRRLAGFVGGRRASERLSASDLFRYRGERAVLLGIAAGALAAAAAGPSWDIPAADPPPDLPPAEIVIAVDVSGSMQAGDEEPTRLAVAVDAARRILEGVETEHVGLLAFAGTAYPLVPPTPDHRVVEYLLDGIVPTIASAQDPGTLLTAALAGALELFDRSDSPPTDAPPQRSIVIVTDGDAGESESGIATMTEAAEGAGIAVHVVAVGSESGAPMTMPRGTYQLGGPIVSADGTPAISRLRAQLLLRLAESGGGVHALANDATELAALTDALAPTMQPPPVRPEAESWRTADPVALLLIVAVVATLLEGLLDARLPRLAGARRRRTA